MSKNLVVPRLYSGTVTMCFDCPGLLIRSSWSYCKKENFKKITATGLIPDWCPLPPDTEKGKI